MTIAVHPFDDALQLETTDAGSLRGRTTPQWANMVGPFGGVTAAVLLRAVQMQPDSFGVPLALTVNFTAPIGDGDFEVVARVARTNRTNQHWVVELRQDGRITTTATAVFAVRRDSWSDTEVRPPDVPAPEEVSATAAPDNGIAWLNRYDLHYITGAIPQDGRPDASSTSMLWARDSAQRPLDYPALAAACDVFFPRVFLRRGSFLPAGTISLTTYFHAEEHELDALGADFVLGVARANRFSRGYFDQSAELWSRGGTLLATSHQIVYFKG